MKKTDRKYAKYGSFLQKNKQFSQKRSKIENFRYTKPVFGIHGNADENVSRAEFTPQSGNFSCKFVRILKIRHREVLYMERMSYKEAGIRIMLLRDKYLYTREDLARITGLSTKFLYEIEVGRKGFSARTLHVLSEVFDVSCDYILTGKDKTSNL